MEYIMVASTCNTRYYVFFVSLQNVNTSWMKPVWELLLLRSVKTYISNFNIFSREDELFAIHSTCENFVPRNE